MEKILNKIYSKDDPDKLIGYDTKTHIASLKVVDGKEEWTRFNKDSGEIEVLQWDPATGEKAWVRQMTGIVIDTSAPEENIEINVDLTIEKQKLDRDPLEELQKIKEKL